MQCPLGISGCLTMGCPERHVHARTHEALDCINLQVLQPAIELAEDGFPVSPVTAHQWQGCFSQLTKAGGPGVSAAQQLPLRTAYLRRHATLAVALKLNPRSHARRLWLSSFHSSQAHAMSSSNRWSQAKALMTPDGKAPAAGQLQRNPDLGATFRRLAEHGAFKGAATTDTDSYSRSRFLLKLLTWAPPSAGLVEHDAAKGSATLTTANRGGEHVRCPASGSG